MKPKEIVYLLGLKPAVKTYGVEVIDCDLGAEGVVQYARWLHPVERRRRLDLSQIAPLRGFLRPGDVAIDIGSQVGDTTVPMALAVGPTGVVLALEPNRHVFPVLATNAALNPGRMRIEPLMFAATEEDGPIEFEYSDAAFNNGGRHEGIDRWTHAHAFTQTVEGRNLQRWLRAEKAELLPRLRYIKVDAEGYDYTILRSLEDLLREHRPYVRAEVYRHTTRATRERLVGFMQALGYRVHHFGGDAGYAGEAIGPRDVMRWRHFDIFCVPVTPA